MKKRILGSKKLEVSALGLGCMGMSMAYGKADDQESLKTLAHAVERGITFFDTADMYGDGHNESLLAKMLQQVQREKLVIATKCGFVREALYQYHIDGSPAHIKAACDASLKRLGIDVIDLYYLHRADRNIPIEESVGALGELVAAGKVHHIGLSEVTPQTLRHAVAVHPITALQTEFSLWQQKPKKELLATCRELGVGFVPYSPLGRGFLTGTIRDTSKLADDDFRRVTPKFQDENFKQNLKIADIITEIATEKRCTPAQLALAWLLAQGDDIVPIPGTRSMQRLDENIGATEVNLTAKDLVEIDKRVDIEHTLAGEQFPKHLDFEV